MIELQAVCSFRTTNQKEPAMHSVLRSLVGIVCLLFQVSSHSQEIRSSENDPMLLIYPNILVNRSNLQVNPAINLQLSSAFIQKKEKRAVDYFFGGQNIPKGKLAIGFIPFPAIYGQSTSGRFRFIVGTTVHNTVVIVEYKF